MQSLAAPLSRPSDPRRYLRKDKLPYRLESFKGRKLDLSEPVQVYRRLLRSSSGEASPSVYSIRQRGLVVAHASALMLRDVTFHVSEAGRQRVLRTGRKNVHAWLSGYLTPSGCGLSPDGEEDLPCRITYNPRTGARFKGILGPTEIPLNRAMVVLIREGRISGAYVA